MCGIINGILLEFVGGGRLGVDLLRQGRWKNMVSVFRGLKARWLFRSQMCMVLMADDGINGRCQGYHLGFRSTLDRVGYRPRMCETV